MRSRVVISVLAWLSALATPAWTQPRMPRTTFEVTYVAAEVVYLDGGSEDGLTEGMELELSRLRPGDPLMAAQPVGAVRVIATAGQSAVCEVIITARPIERGDRASLSAADAEDVAYLMTSRNSRGYAQIVTFTDMDIQDPLEDEQRRYVPRPPLSEINRRRGRVSFQQSSLIDRSSGTSSNQAGVSLRADMTRIDGTYWDFTGYWRGHVNSRTRGSRDETLTDLINRTYHIGLRYNNPNSRNTMGFGRLLLPWASSLSTIDGGYYGRRLSKSNTTGVFAGSTPDPTAWNFDPNRQMLGVFSSFESGSYDEVRYSGTVGAAHTRRHGQPERQFAFLQNSVSVQRKVSLYHNAEVDYRSRGRFGSNVSGPTLSRSYLTLRTQPNDVVSFDVSHNYFRGVPTFDDRLIGSGLIDDLLFQGVSGGMRVRLPNRSAAYFQLGQSNRRSDDKPSWNYMLGYTHGRLPWLGMRADFRTSRFSSSFGTGRYHTVTLSQDIRDKGRFELQAGRQEFDGTLSRQNRSLFLNGRVEWFLGRQYCLGLGVTDYRGRVQNYNQVYLDLGYRF